VRELLKEATEPRELADGSMSTVPDVVQTARDVALGKVPPPSRKPVKKEVYTPIKEPPLGPEDGPTTIERAGG
jgi:hypothetical protein